MFVIIQMELMYMYEYTYKFKMFKISESTFLSPTNWLFNFG